MSVQSDGLTLVKPSVSYQLPGERRDDGVRVVEGMLALYVPLSSGGRRITGLAVPGEYIMAGHGVGVAALMPSKIKPAIMLQNGEAYEVAARTARIAMEWLARDSLDMAGRLAHLLCELCVRGDYTSTKPFPVPTQVQMGEITGQTSVNVNRVVQELTRAKIIRRPKPRLVAINDFGELRRIGSWSEDYLK